MDTSTEEQHSMNELYFEKTFTVEIDGDEAAKELAAKDNVVQGAFLNALHKALKELCQTQFDMERQGLYIAEELTEETAKWLIVVGSDALKSLESRSKS